MAVLFSQPLLKIYRAPILSCSFLFCFFLLIITIILPFFLAFSTYDFWKKREVYLEQPNVLYRKELIVMVYTESDQISGGSLMKTSSVKTFSTLGKINNLYYQSLSPMLITSSLLDFNFDNVADQFNFNITVFADVSTIRSVKVMSFYDYRIRNRMKMDLVGMAYVEINTPVGASSIYIDGSLDFHQNMPMNPSKVIKTDYNSSVLDLELAVNNYLPRLMMEYNRRNFTTIYNYKSVVLPKGSDNNCKITMKVRIPASQQYEYVPGFLETMKFSWVQYLSLIIPIGYVIYNFACFIFANQILDAHISYEKKH